MMGCSLDAIYSKTCINGINISYKILYIILNIQMLYAFRILTLI